MALMEELLGIENMLAGGSPGQYQSNGDWKLVLHQQTPIQSA
jgi:hypothetical protein